ncbi:MAG: S8 family serine peptidase [Nostoc sp.]|uniref:S8 family serine peptidase n=1 Tax=Nostoc sp. TaxID=1180 RepID=UPI002FF724BD
MNLFGFGGKKGQKAKNSKKSKPREVWKGKSFPLDDIITPSVLVGGGENSPEPFLIDLHTVPGLEIDPSQTDLLYELNTKTLELLNQPHTSLLDHQIMSDWLVDPSSQSLSFFDNPGVSTNSFTENPSILYNPDVCSVDSPPPGLDSHPDSSDGTSALPTFTLPDVDSPGYVLPFDPPATDKPPKFNFKKSDQPLIGVIDTGFNANNPDIDYSRVKLGRDLVDNDNNPLLADGEGSEHGTHVLGIIGATEGNGIGIDGINDQAPIWVGRAIGSGKWAESLKEFVDEFKTSGQPNGVVNLSFDLTQTNPDGSVTTRYELTPQERAVLEYARQNHVLIVAAAGNDGGVMSGLGQASQEFDNIITVGAADGKSRAAYSSYGQSLDILASGGTAEKPKLSTLGDGVGTMAGTSVATANVTGAASLVWAANPGLSYRQVIEILKSTATDLGEPGWDEETGAGLLNIADAVDLAKVTQPEVRYDLAFNNLSNDEMSLNLDTAFEAALPGFGSISELDDEDLSSFTAEERTAYEEAAREISSELNEYLARASQKIALEYTANNFGMQVEAMEKLLDVFDEETLESLAQAQDILRNSGFSADLKLETLAIASNYNNEEIGNASFIPSERPVAVSVPAFNAQILNAGYVSQVGFLRIRSAPSTNSAEVGRKYPGQTVTFDAFENNGTWVPDPYMPGGGSSRWYKIAGTNQWMSALYFNNTPEQAAQERVRQEAIRRAEEEARLAAEAAQRAAEAAQRAAEAAQRALEEALRRAQEEALRRAQEEALRRIAEVKANTDYWVAQTSLLPTPQKHIEYELIAKDLVYNDYKEGEDVKGYKVEKVFKQGEGLYALGLTKDGYPPVLVFRGSKEEIDWVDNAHPGGVGVGQYNAALQQGIDKWLEEKANNEPKPDVIGHSLGGALAQLTAADFSKWIGEIVTFNAPGISPDRLSRFKGGVQVTHYISPTDIVSRAGWAFLPGTIYEMRFKGDPLQQHTNIFLHDPNTICIPVTKQEISDRSFDWMLSRLESELLRQGIGKQFSPYYLATDAFNLTAYYGSKVLDGISQGIKDGADAVGSFINEGILALQRKAQEAQGIANTAFEKVKEVRQLAQEKVQQAQAAYQDFKQETQKRISEVVQSSQQKIQQAAQKVAQTIKNVTPKVADAITKFAKGAVNATKAVINTGKQIVNNIINTAKQVVNNVINIAQEVASTVKTVIHNTYNAGVKLVAETAKTVQNAVSNTVNTVSKGFNMLKSAFGF